MLHLPPAHHEISKHDSPNETKVKEKQNKTIPNSNSNLTKSMTYHNQTKKLITWFLSWSSHKSGQGVLGCFTTCVWGSETIEEFDMWWNAIIVAYGLEKNE
jgi:hypothetical protein